ncbi:trypsin-1-like [Cephus cinctus]|uniref:limulus clotting factor C n=1 Tax=Cephus cinctus TaxID=211228 RepID=A0AAJ7CEQ8_CEPCN|nr:trypsin-1-like [Cephus cinctus]
MKTICQSGVEDIGFRKVDVMLFEFHLLFHSILYALARGEAENATIENYPYHISVEFSGKHFCSGALITESWVITAASCVSGRTISDINVRIGTSISSFGGTELAIGKIIVHDNFDKYTYDDDIALLKLENPIEFNDKLQPIILPVDYTVEDGSSLLVTGWRKKAYGGSESQLKVTAVPVVNLNTCNSTMPGFKPLSRRMLCAGYMTSGVETCQGDSGAPLVTADDTIVGILSFGLGCLYNTYPGVYTRVGSYLNWISSNAGILI